MNWAAGLYAAALWTLAASLWVLYRPVPRGAPLNRVLLQVARDLTPGLLLGYLIARLAA